MNLCAIELIVNFILYICISAVSEDPEFTDIIENITVAQGRNVKFGCSVKNLGTYKVRTILT